MLTDREIVEFFDAFALNMGEGVNGTDYSISERELEKFAHAVAEETEVDKYDALEVQDAAWKEIEAELLLQMEGMREALEPFIRHSYLLPQGGVLLADDELTVEEVKWAHKVFSSTRKRVLWMGPVEVRMDSEGLPILVPLDDMMPLERMDGKEFKAAVLTEPEESGEG